jgi:ribonuclease R
MLARRHRSYRNLSFQRQKLEGSVLEVLERANDTFVGTFQYVQHKDFGFVVVDKKQINNDFLSQK